MLQSFLPVQSFLLDCQLRDDGWWLWVTHRHLAGRSGDCGVDQYHPLTADELLDVLAAVGATLTTLGTTPLEDQGNHCAHQHE